MTQADELLGSKTPMGADLALGVQTLALDQEIEFSLYGRVVLPIDGFVFWVRADLLSQPALKGLFSVEQLSAVEMDESGGKCIKVQGSLHYAADTRQEEGELWTANRVIFTSESETNPLDAIAPNTMWIGSFEGLRFGFSKLSRYKQADLWHYEGFAIYPDMTPQIIDRVEQFSTDQVVSNSLPAWLAMQAYQPEWAYWNPAPPIYPSMQQPLNLRPPFVTVHVVPEETIALAAAPSISRKTSSHQQLCADTVHLTLWGMRNDAAMDLVDQVYRYSADTAAFGIMGPSLPVVRDEKRGQVELGMLAQKKTIEFQVSYIQTRQRAIAQQVIKSCIPTFNGVAGAPLGPALQLQPFIGFLLLEGNISQ